MKVEHQIAIIYCGVNELLRFVPVEKIKEFETAYLELMEMEHRDVLDSLREGNLTEKIEKVLKDVAIELVGKYKKKTEPED
jgi:F-type H+-transporting ATPase subunit alpha